VLGFYANLAPTPNSPIDDGYGFFWLGGTPTNEPPFGRYSKVVMGVEEVFGENEFPWQPNVDYQFILDFMPGESKVEICDFHQKMTKILIIK